MSRGAAAQIQDALGASREQADWMLARAAEDARELEANAALIVTQRARQRIEQIEQMRASIARHSAELEASFARLAETLAAISAELAGIARTAEFKAPEWPGGLARTVELRLSETRTRELTIRVQSGGPG